jgi:hypothetical protein
MTTEDKADAMRKKYNITHNELSDCLGYAKQSVSVHFKKRLNRGPQYISILALIYDKTEELHERGYIFTKPKAR